MTLSLDYIAGLIDADGSFSISVSKNRYKKADGTSTAQFGFVINFRQLEIAAKVLEEIQLVLGGGSIYTHSHSGYQKMLTWQTTRGEESRRIAKILLPFLHIKNNSCELFIRALDLWLDTPREFGKGSGKPRIPDWVREEVIEISSQMNPSQQKETSRRNKEIRDVVLV